MNMGLTTLGNSITIRLRTGPRQRFTQTTLNCGMDCREFEVIRAEQGVRDREFGTGTHTVMFDMQDHRCGDFAWSPIDVSRANAVRRTENHATTGMPRLSTSRDPIALYELAPAGQVNVTAAGLRHRLTATARIDAQEPQQGRAEQPRGSGKGHRSDDRPISREMTVIPLLAAGSEIHGHTSA